MSDTQLMHLRIEEHLHQRISDAARRRKVSASREVNDQLEKSYGRRDPIADIAADVKKLIRLQSGEG